MATLDIRGQGNEEIDRIRFGAVDFLTKSGDNWFWIRTNDGGEEASVYMKDIDNLILALQKAKELWAK